MIERLSDTIKIVLVVVVLSFGFALKAEETRLKGFFDKFPAAVKKEIEKDFSYNLYQGADDVYNKRNSQREFYTNPGTTIPNDRNTLLKWAYHLPPTCKQGDGTGCWRLVYQQYKRNPLPINPI